MIAASTRAWLPASALTRDAVYAALAPGLDRWAARWFVGEIAGIAAMAGTAETRADQDVPRVGDRQMLIEKALATDGTMPMGEADERLLNEFADGIAADLLEQLEYAPNAVERGVELAITLAGRTVLTLTLAEPDLVARVKAAVPRTARERPPLTARSTAARGTAVAVEAVLGLGGLTLAELETIAIGDVVRLDRRLDEGVTLRLAGSGHTLAQGRLSRDGAMPAILL